MALYFLPGKLSAPVGPHDTSGLTVRSDWQNVCAAAATWPVGDALRFFETRFELARVGEGTTYVTGYYEPEISGSRTTCPALTCRSMASLAI
jgi:hypothetical protein